MTNKEEKSILPADNLQVKNGRLFFGGHDTVALAEKYGTPLMLIDEVRIRQNCRTIQTAAKKHFGSGARVLYAGKALCFKGLYRILKDENMSVDVVSTGEIYTALNAGFSAANMFYHGNNKTLGDIQFAIENKVGYFVADNPCEIELIAKAAAEKGIKQNILIRITPGIDPHTHEAVKTGKVDSKFGVAIATGQAEEAIRLALGKSSINLCGYHCHIGSQIFDSQPFIMAADIMTDFIASIKKTCGYVATMLNIGGGFGVRYIDSQPTVDIEGIIKEIAQLITDKCKKLKIDMPEILLEPGRSIVADAGLTLYTAGGLKQITGYKNYLPVDGGMTDNPRYALYQSPYTVLLANRAEENADFECTIAGRCCESGDLIQENVMLPTPNAGDIVAVATTGAYNYSMASNYNRVARPLVVMLAKDKDSIAVKRETLEDLVRNDI